MACPCMVIILRPFYPQPSSSYKWTFAGVPGPKNAMSSCDRDYLRMLLGTGIFTYIYNKKKPYIGKYSHHIPWHMGFASWVACGIIFSLAKSAQANASMMQRSWTSLAPCCPRSFWGRKWRKIRRKACDEIWKKTNQGNIRTLTFFIPVWLVNEDLWEIS